jgi:hypothetical protein
MGVYSAAPVKDQLPASHTSTQAWLLKRGAGSPAASAAGRFQAGVPAGSTAQR